jgi:lysophospholipase
VAPMLGIALVANERHARLSAMLGCWLGRGNGFVPGGGETASATKPFANNRLSRDPARYGLSAHLASAARHLAIGDPSVRWAAEAFRLMARLARPEVPLAITMPTMVIAAGDDPVVSLPAIMRFTARLKTGSALVIPGARHEILHETDAIRQQFWAAFDAFIPGERELAEIVAASA